MKKRAHLETLVELTLESLADIVGGEGDELTITVGDLIDAAGECGGRGGRFSFGEGIMSCTYSDGDEGGPGE